MVCLSVYILYHTANVAWMAVLVSSRLPLLSTLKYLSNYWMDFLYLHGILQLRPDDFVDPLTFFFQPSSGQIFNLSDLLLTKHLQK